MSIDPSGITPDTEEHLAAAGVAVNPRRRTLFREILRRPIGTVSLVVLALIVLAVVLAPLLTSSDPAAASLQDVLGPRAPGHPLGFDSAGRDVWARLLYGGRFTLAAAMLAVLVAASIGITAGLIAGYFHGAFDKVSSWLASLMMAMPVLILLLALRTVIGPSLWWTMVAFGVILSPSYFRLVYASVNAVRDELYLDAARVAGISDRRIIARHVLTVVRAPVIIQSVMIVGIAVAIQAGLDFLGLGNASIPTWGTMLNDGFINLYNAPRLVVWPTAAIVLLLVSLNLLATTMRDVLERTQQPSRRRKAPRPADAPNAGDETARTVVHADRSDPDEAPLLTVEHLSVGYEQPAGQPDKVVVQDVSLSVRRGEVLGLIGESGSGKTQTAWAIMRLLSEGGHILTGRIVFDGQDLADASERAMAGIRGRRIAYIPQEPMANLDPSFTVGSQLVRPIRHCLGISRADARDKALALLERVGIPDPARTFGAYPHELSGGMAQRVLIAGAVACKPDLLIADEPTTALDVTVQAEVLDLIRSLQDEYRMGVVLVTHNFGVVADLCDRVSVMREGRIVESGPVRSIFRAAEHPYTKSLLAAIVDEGQARAPYGTGPSPVSNRSGTEVDS
ncbi:dipeptide/oligopeptide/nickel ABC transporter permease/ATP-binding protein [Cellulomonas sp. McL0617]|uniref:dipeptide/oligopeptide/nickel ABC transporter permease/ATP-binding protein n=1 Tax=Cellulomonas sp. McL0617 TaxID=3415675 RepID=UPI003CF98FC1